MQAKVSNSATCRDGNGKYLYLCRMKKKQKYYVVWAGVSPGIYDSWTDCQLQTKGYDGARFKSFDTREEAERAFASSPYDYIGPKSSTGQIQKPSRTDGPLPPEVVENSLAVDAACSGNPGQMEYRGVHVASRQQVFHYGPVRSWAGPAEAEGVRHAHLQRQPQRHPLGKAKEMQNQTPPRAAHRGSLPTHRTGREVAAREHLHHAHPEVGDGKVGRGAGRLRTEIGRGI